MQYIVSNELYHYGVYGMKWGKRKRSEYNTVDRTTRKAQKKFEKSINKGWYKSYNKACIDFNNRIDNINRKYENDDFTKGFSSKRGQKYVKEVNKTWQDTYAKCLINDFGEEPITRGKEYVEKAPLMNQYLSYIN